MNENIIWTTLFDLNQWYSDIETFLEELEYCNEK